LVIKNNGILYREGSLGIRKLTLEEQVLYKKKILTNEQNIANTKANIERLKGLTDAEKEAAKQTDAAESTKQEAKLRTIEIIDAEIKAEEDKISGLSDKSGAEGRAIKAKIAALKAERELIYSTDKADKDATKDYLKRRKEVEDAIYNLSQFRYQNNIDINKKIIEDEDSTFEQITNSLNDNIQLRDAKNEESFRKELLNNALAKDGLEKLSKDKLAIYINESKARIESILSGNTAVKDMTDAELLIYEKYYADLKKFRDQDEKDKEKLIDSQVEKLQKQIDKQNQVTDTALNNRITRENENFAETLKGLGNNFELVEAATVAHERRLLKITQDANKQKLQVQIDTMQQLLADNDKLPENERLSAEKRAKYENDLSKFKRQLSELGVEQNQTDNVLILESEKAKQERLKELIEEGNERTKQLATDLASSLIDLTNSIFDARISSIDSEIQAVNESYDAQIAAAGNDQRQKDLLEKEKLRKTKELEKEKKKELIKAAIFNKVITLAQIGLDLAKTLTAINLAAIEIDALTPYAFGSVGAAYRAVQIPLAVGTSVAQAAVVLATPLPKLKKGREGGKAGLNITGDGGVHEVITDPDGSNPRLTPKTPTITYLNKDDKVFSSVRAYNEYLNAQMLSGISSQTNMLKGYGIDTNDFDRLESTLEKGIEQGFKKAKINIHNNNQPGTDINYQLWRMGNINWGKS